MTCLNKISVCLLIASFSLAFSLAQECAAVVIVNEATNGRTLESVAAHNGTALAVGADGLVMLSTNGEMWSTLASGTTDDFVDVVWAGDRFALLANRIGRTTVWTWDENNGLLELPNLINTITGKEGHALGWAPPNLIISFMDNLLVRGEIHTTQDFVSLSDSTLDINRHCGEVIDIDTVNGVTVIGAQCTDQNGFFSGVLTYVSLNGINFSPVSMVSGEALGPRGLATNGTAIFAVGSIFASPPFNFDPFFYHTSQAGNSYTQYPQDGSMRTQLADADWVDPYFLGVGPAGFVLKSSNGLNWQSIPSPNTGLLRSVTPYNTGFFLAVGENETILLGTTEAFLSILDTWPETSDCTDLIRSLDNCLSP